LPGAAHDLTAGRTHGIIEALTDADVMTLACRLRSTRSGGAAPHIHVVGRHAAAPTG
jgi:hypothetical protein